MVPDVSVVIPVHQAESFIRATIESVISGLMGVKGEIICVLDNCTDNTESVILSTIASCGENVFASVYNVKLASVSRARNYGVEKACGDYVAFVDHDDFVVSRAYAKMLSCARIENADVVRCGYSKKGKDFWVPEILVLGRVYYAFFGIFVWNGLFSSELLKKNRVLFKEGYGEDYQFNFEVAIFAQKVAWVKEVLYHWALHDNNQHKKRTPLDFVLRVERLYRDNYELVSSDPNSKVALYRFVSDNFFHHASQFGFHSTLSVYKQSHVVRDIIDCARFDYRGVKRCFVDGSSRPTRMYLRLVALGDWAKVIGRRIGGRLPINLLSRCKFYVAKGLRSRVCRKISESIQAGHLAGIGEKRVFAAFLVYDQDCISGGIISIFKLAELSRQFADSGVVQVFTGPGRQGVSRYTRFENSEVLLSAASLFEFIRNARISLLHIPEVLVCWFFDEAERLGVDYSGLHVNILNQNSDLMPSRDLVDRLRSKTRFLTQTTAHVEYSGKEFYEKYGIPLTHISTYMSPLYYQVVEFEKKENNILISHDQHYRRQDILGFLFGSFVGYEKIVVVGMTYQHYLTLVAKSKYAITLGEGLDNYFIECVFSGGVPFALYNPSFMPREMLELDNVCEFDDDFLDLIDRVVFKCETDSSYREVLWEKNYSYLGKIYSYDYHVEKLSAFYKGEYDWGSVASS